MAAPIPNLPLLRRRLLTWFDAHQRELPWRHDRDPYRIWVSEVMLQQTTVATVRSRFEAFLTAFPTVTALAAADEQEVLRAWEGLGYYRRARHLHAAARHIVATGNGEFCNDVTWWAELPGVGRYILGAILSQAYDRRMPIIEANSIRVLCRLFGQSDDPKVGSTQQWLWKTAEEILPRRRVGDFNQAIMELGALICTPSKPRCESCPVADQCVAFRGGLQDAIPRKPAGKTLVEVREVALVIRQSEKVLLARRPDFGRWSNMWEFPHGELEPKEGTDAAARRLAKRLLNLRITVGPELMTIRHGVTHHRITMICVDCTLGSGQFRSPFYVEGRWVTPAECREFPVSSPQRKLARTLTSPVRQRR